MEDKILKKLDRIEKMLFELNTKVNTLLGLEELTDEEKKGLEEIKEKFERWERMKSEGTQ